MAFFDLPKDEDLPPESLKMLEEYRRVTGTKGLSSTWKIFGRFPKIIEARFLASKNLNQEASFSFDARCIAVMLIAHAKRCQACSHQKAQAQPSLLSARCYSRE